LLLPMIGPGVTAVGAQVGQVPESDHATKVVDRRISPLFAPEEAVAPTRATQLALEPCDPQLAREFVGAWHSRLPTTQVGPWLLAFVAHYQFTSFGAALWHNPSARGLPDDWLELRRLAIPDDAPPHAASWMLGAMRRWIGANMPRVSRLISYQDVEVHTGTIYKAAGWEPAYFSKPRLRDRTPNRGSQRRRRGAEHRQAVPRVSAGEDAVKCGTLVGYSAGCRCTACRRARRDHEVQRRRDAARGITYLVDATGTHRRIRALMRLGWSSKDIAQHCGWATGDAVLQATQRPKVNRRTAAKVARAYGALSMMLGPSDTTRRRAERAGWPPPLAWDDERIDDPVHSPAASVDDLTLSEIDEAVVLRVLAGEHLPTNRAERQEILRRWVARGGSQATLCKRLGWKQGRYAQAPVDGSLGVVGRKPHPRSVTVQREAS
jgi:hypothetical protein